MAAARKEGLLHGNWHFCHCTLIAVDVSKPLPPSHDCAIVGAQFSSGFITKNQFAGHWQHACRLSEKISHLPTPPPKAYVACSSVLDVDFSAAGFLTVEACVRCVIQRCRGSLHTVLAKQSQGETTSWISDVLAYVQNNE